MSFSAEFDVAAKRTLDAAEKTMRATGLTLFSEIIKRTPVDTGRLRGNWQTTLNGPAAGILQATDKTGSVATGKINTTLAQYDLTKSMFFTNNLPYASHIEHGTSKLRPYAMVKLSIQSVNTALAKNAKKFQVK